MRRRGRRACVPVPKSRRRGADLSGDAVCERPGGRRRARGAAGDADLAVDVLDVALDRAHAEDELGRDRVVRAPAARRRSTSRSRGVSSERSRPPSGTGAPRAARAAPARASAASASVSRPARAAPARARAAPAPPRSARRTPRTGRPRPRTARQTPRAARGRAVPRPAAARCRPRPPSAQLVDAEARPAASPERQLRPDEQLQRGHTLEAIRLADPAQEALRLVRGHARVTAVERQRRAHEQRRAMALGLARAAPPPGPAALAGDAARPAGRAPRSPCAAHRPGRGRPA